MGALNFVRPFLEEDFPQIEKWFLKRQWPNAPRLNILPDTGFVVTDGVRLLAAAWLYISNSSVAYLEWSVTNPDEPPLETVRAMKMMIKYIQEQTQLLNPPVTDIIQFIPSEKLVQFYEKHLGFKELERATLMVWRRPGGE